MQDGASPARDSIFQVARLSPAYPERRGQPSAAILSDVTVEVDRGGALTLVGVVETISRLRQAWRLSIVAVTHSPELVRRLGGALLYLVKGSVQAYERPSARCCSCG